MTAQLQALRAALATVRQLEEQIETATKAVEATMTEQEMDAADDRLDDDGLPLSTLCRCGHANGAHHIPPPHPCDECTCEAFR